MNDGFAGGLGLYELEEQIALLELARARLAAAVLDRHAVFEVQRQRRRGGLWREDVLVERVGVLTFGVGDIAAAFGFAELDLCPARIRTRLGGVHPRLGALVGRDPRKRKCLCVCRCGTRDGQNCDKYQSFHLINSLCNAFR